MRRWPAASLAAVAAWTLACAPRTAPPAELAGAPQSTMGDDAAAARAVALAFLDLEARGDSAADSLLAPDADFLVTGIRVTARPRLAGINGPGTATAEEVTVGSAGPLAWIVIAYRVAARTPALSERARGTFVLEKQRAGWRIRHVHSSMVERWDR